MIFTITNDAEGKEAHERLLQAMMAMKKPFTVGINQGQFSTCVIKRGQRVGQLGIGKTVALSSVAKCDVEVTVMRVEQ